MVVVEEERWFPAWDGGAGVSGRRRRRVPGNGVEGDGGRCRRVVVVGGIWGRS